MSTELDSIKFTKSLFTSFSGFVLDHSVFTITLHEYIRKDDLTSRAGEILKVLPTNIHVQVRNLDPESLLAAVSLSLYIQFRSLHDDSVPQNIRIMKLGDGLGAVQGLLVLDEGKARFQI